VKGRRGTIVRAQGGFRDPETRAYRGDGEPRRNLYLVRFAQTELWPGYSGPAADALLADVYEHWLAEAS
jgi:nitrile hydratase